MRKVRFTEQYVEWLREILDDIVYGKLSPVQARDIINTKARNVGLDEISVDSIRRHVRKLLENEPKKLEQYKITLKQNWREIPEEVIINEFDNIINHKMTLKQVAEKYHKTPRTIKKIIMQHLEGDLEELEIFQLAVKDNRGVAREKREEVKEKWEEIQKEQVVLKSEFISMSEVEKRSQIILKRNKSKINNVKGKNLSSDSINKKIDEILDYFQKRNSKHPIEAKKTQISRDDALLMIFRLPTMLQYSIDGKMNDAINSLDMNDEIGFINANHILKTFPGFLCYSKERRETIIKILKDNDILYFLIEKPMLFMLSPKAIYALIQFAKDNHKDKSLSELKINSIMMNNPTLKRVYKTTLDELIETYPLPNEYQSSQNNSNNIVENMLFETQNVGLDEVNELTKQLAISIKNKAKEGVNIDYDDGKQSI